MSRGRLPRVFEGPQFCYSGATEILDTFEHWLMPYYALPPLD
jgi:hypothetical protein